jgi:hypothetical protein
LSIHRDFPFCDGDFPLSGLYRCRRPVRASSKGNAVVTFEWLLSNHKGRELFAETERSKIGDLKVRQSTALLRQIVSTTARARASEIASKQQ